MRHSIYMNIKKPVVEKSYKVSLSALEKNTGYKAPLAIKPVEIKDKDLSNRVSKVLEAYEDDPETRAEILNRVSMYELNMTLAAEYKDKKQQKKLNRELENYIYGKEVKHK